MLAGGLALCLALGGGPAGPAKGIRWERAFEQALREGKRTGKPLMVDFWAEWCEWCKRLDRTTYADAAVVRLADQFVPVKVNTEGTQREVETAGRYGVTSLPTIAFLSPEGRLLLRVDGFQGPGQFPETMEAARQLSLRVGGWEAGLRRDGADVEALAELGRHLFEQEFYEDSRDLLAKAVKLDAERPASERKRSRLLLSIIQHYDKKFREAEGLLKEGLALRPPNEYDAKLLFVLGRTYKAWGRPDDARNALRKVVSDYPQSAMAQKARETLFELERR
jgi:thioredoxin-like negative regulator of GroEL